MVTLAEILEAKEQRVELQRRLTNQFNKPLVSFTLNIAGETKDFPLSRITFRTGLVTLQQALISNNIEIFHTEIVHGNAGQLAVLCVNADAKTVKAIMCIVEESSELGRLFDVDVIDTDGLKVSRTLFAQTPRKCFLCDNDAFVCGRSRAHDIDLVFGKVLSLMKTNEDCAEIFDNVSDNALKALLYEVSASPKPGLVDRFNNGAHKDMDFFTFVNSSVAIRKYYYEVTQLGFYNEQENLQHLFEQIRTVGKTYDLLMFTATNGVNTHKGLIFSLGVLSCAVGVLLGKGESLNYSNIFETCKQLTKGLSQRDFAGVNVHNAQTNGEKLFAKFGVLGIRAEVEQGFPTVSNVSLPVFERLMFDKVNINDACVLTLLHIMATLNDTNVLFRHDEQTLEYVKQSAQKAIELGAMTTEVGRAYVYNMDNEFIDKNISPGGCADILAVTIVVYNIVNDRYFGGYNCGRPLKTSF